MRNSSLIFKNEHIKMKLIHGSKSLNNKSSTYFNSNKSIEKDNNNTSNTPFQIIRTNLDNKKRSIEKKKDKEIKLNLNLFFKHNGLKNNNGNRNINTERKLVKNIESPSGRMTMMNLTKSDKNVHHLYRITETMLKDANKSVTFPKVNFVRFYLKNSVNEEIKEILPNIPSNIKYATSYLKENDKGKNVLLNSSSYLDSAVKMFKKNSQGQNTEKGNLYFNKANHF